MLGRTPLNRLRHAAPLRLLLVVALSVFVAAFVAGGAAADTPVFQGPDLPSMGLAVSDFAPGASVLSEGFRSPSSPAVAQYERDFKPGLRLGGYPIFTAESTVVDFGDTGAATFIFSELRTELNTPAGRRAFAKAALASSRRGGTAKVSLVVGAPVSLSVGQGAFRLLARLTARAHARKVFFDIELVVVRLDRAVGLVAFGGYPNSHIPPSLAVQLAQKLDTHFQSAFTVRNLTPPSVTGTPQNGQTLSAVAGSWAGAPSGVTYQWSRCDAAGANCVPIPAATAQTYVLGPADAGATLTVTVTAANSVSKSSVASSATAAVS